MDVTVDFRKADISCSAPTTLCPGHQGIGIPAALPHRHHRAAGEQRLRLHHYLEWNGGAFMSSSVQVTFDDAATSLPVRSTPQTGTFDRSAA